MFYPHWVDAVAGKKMVEVKIFYYGFPVYCGTEIIRKWIFPEGDIILLHYHK